MTKISVTATILGILSILVSITAEATIVDCSEILLNGSQDSHTHQLRIDHGYDGLPMKIAAPVAVLKLLDKSGCVIEGVLQTKCGTALPNNPLTEICYSESSHGYYIVQRDFLSNINIIVNRWD